jgi:hypothetical protein
MQAVSDILMRPVADQGVARALPGCRSGTDRATQSFFVSVRDMINHSHPREILAMEHDADDALCMKRGAHSGQMTPSR